LDEIHEHIEVGHRGWQNPEQDPLTELSEKVSTVKLNIKYRYNGQPQRIDEFTKDRLANYLPTIVWIDKTVLNSRGTDRPATETLTRDEGPLHAAVVIGVGEDQITYHDPLLRGSATVEIDKLEDAWDPKFNTAIRAGLKDYLVPRNGGSA